MTGLVWIFGSVLAVSLISLVGILAIAVKEDLLKKILVFLVSFSTGGLFGGAFLHLIPETVEEFGFGVNTSIFLLSGIVLFFVTEKIIQWHHCHRTPSAHEHCFTYMNLIGDGVHNFVDGLVIAGSYLASVPLGITTTIAVLLHEIPQEIGDFGVLVHGGFSKKKALAFNFLSAATAFLGAGVAIVLSGMTQNFLSFLLPFAAGGFIYIAGSDLIPELHKERSIKASVIQLITFLLGIGVMLAFLGLE